MNYRNKRCPGLNIIDLRGNEGAMHLVNARRLYRLGLRPERLRRDEIVSLTGVNGRLPAHLHRFANQSVGPVKITSPKILAAGVTEAGFDMILAWIF
jgi:hypothetical protein